MSAESFAARRALIKSIREGGSWIRRLENSRLRGSPYPTHVAGAIKAILQSTVPLPHVTEGSAELFAQQVYPAYPVPFHRVMGREMEAYAMSVYLGQVMSGHHYHQVDEDSFIAKPLPWRPHFG